MLDNRISVLAKNLVNYSVKAGKGDKVLIEAYDVDSTLVNCLVDEIRANGAYAFVELYDSKVQRRLLLNADETYCKLLEKYNRVRMERNKSVQNPLGHIALPQRRHEPACGHAYRKVRGFLF